MLSFFSFSMEAQFVNRFKDSSYFKLGVKFDSAITFIKDAGEGKVLTSDSNGYAQWRTPLVYVTEKQLSDSIVSVRMYRNVDTIYKNISEDSIIFLIKGTRYSITDNDNSFSTFTMFKNVSGDSIITIHDGVRLAVKDSTGTQDLSLYVPYTGATTNIDIGNNNYIGLYKSNTNSNLSTLITRSSTGLEQNISADAYKLLNTNISNRIGMYGGSNATIGASNAYSSVVIAANNVTEASSGNHPIISQLAIRPIYLAGSSATTTNASTLYIEDATTPIGGATISNNYAMWVDKGISRFDSSIILFSEPVNSILALNSSSKITSLDTSLYPSLLELSYVKGTDSSIQKQLTKKVNSNTEITINNVTQDLSQNRTWTIFVPTKTSELTNDFGFLTSPDLSSYLTTSSAASSYQPILVSGTNIKTINGNSLLGTGDVTISGAPALTSGSIPFSNGSTLISSADITFDAPNRTLKIGHNSKNGKIYMIGDGTPFSIESLGGNNIFRLYTGTTAVNRRVCIAFTNPNTEWAVGFNTSDGKFRISQGGDLGGDGSCALAIDKITRNVGIGTTTPSSSAKLDVWSTTQGFAPPEMTAAQASAIITTNRKIIIYVTNTNATFTSAGLWMWNGTLWKLIMSE